MRIGFGSDPNASELKTILIDYAISLGHEVVDYGSDDPVYAHTAVDVAERVVAGDVERGVVLCGTGIGVSISANKVRGAYCALITDAYQAERAQLSNDANMVAIGAQITGAETAKRLLHDYLGVRYDDASRSAPKVAAIHEYERRKS